MAVITSLGRYQNFYFYFAIILLAAFLSIMLGQTRNVTKKELAYPWLLAILTLLVSFQLEHVVIDALKHYYKFPRPFIALPKGSFWSIRPDIGVPQYWESFPSGHAAFALTISAALWPVMGRVAKIIIGSLVLLVGYSRVALGMHFPADIIGGFVVAYAVVLVTRAVINKLFKRIAT